MKKILSIIMLLFFANSVSAEEINQRKESIAVVKGKYDDIENVLSAYKIKYDLVNYAQLEKKEIFTKYTVMFFPCGIEPPVEDSINIMAFGANINSVSLQKDYKEIDKNKITNNIKQFIENGGSSYFSGYSFTILQNAFDIFGFHDNFPYMGLEGRIDAKLNHDLERFMLNKDIVINMTTSGWVALKSASDSEILAEATYETPRGQKSGPIIISAERGKGNFIFTSYYTTSFSDFRRYSVFRTIGINFLNDEIKKTVKLSQSLSGSVVDAIQKDESHRMYFFNLSNGYNTLYLKTSGKKFQVDIYDSDMSLIESRDSGAFEQSFEIKSNSDSYCFVKIYPSTEERHSIYSLVMATGWKFFPHYKNIFWVAGIIAALFLISYALNAVFGRKYLPWIGK
jgi:hypothetical protein